MSDSLATYDALGRKQPKRLGFVEHARRMPWLMRYFTKQVPGEFFIRVGDTAVIACPCKASDPRVPINIVTRCDGDGCGRWFLFDGRNVRVAREPQVEDTEVRD